ncbi:MAG: helix-turn-helix transcriptional regulator [Clostridiales bacterium]|nr:helix-turn-helix transcriptional regulator [Candidatus Blautia equi]
MEPVKDYNSQVGLRLWKFREGMNLSREAFGERCNLSPSFLSDIEKGRKSFTAKTIFKICTTFGITADFLLFGKNESPDADLILEMLRPLDPDSREDVRHIVSTYVEGIKRAEEKRKKK